MRASFFVLFATLLAIPVHAAEGGPEFVLRGEPGSGFGAWFVHVADLDNDGVAELVVGSTSEDSSSLQLFLSSDLVGRIGAFEANDLSVGELWSEQAIDGAYAEGEGALLVLRIGDEEAVVDVWHMLYSWGDWISDVADPFRPGDGQPLGVSGPCGLWPGVSLMPGALVCSDATGDALYGSWGGGSSTTDGDDDDSDSDSDGPAPDSQSDDDQGLDSRPFGVDVHDIRIADFFGEHASDFYPHTPGAHVGLTVPWSSQSETTLDGEVVADLLLGAAGDELVVDGRFVHRIPLEVPGGPLAPSLAIEFARGADEEHLGRHWRIPLSRIERRSPHGGKAWGTPDDSWFLDGRRLIPDPLVHSPPGQSAFIADDSGTERVTRFTSPTRWEVGSVGRVAHYGSGGFLTRTVDEHGNAVLYEQLGGKPATVAWGEPESPAPDPDRPASQRVHLLEFVYSGELQSVTHLVSPTGYNHQVERSWSFTYEVSEPANQTLLSEVWQHGAPDEFGQVNEDLRLRQFHYRNDLEDGFDGSAVGWGDGVDLAAQFPGTEGQRMRVIRANHDALPDVLFLEVSGAWDSYANRPVCQLEDCLEPPDSACAPDLSDPACIDPVDSRWLDQCHMPATARLFLNQGNLQFQEAPAAAGVIQAWLDFQGPAETSIDAFLGGLSFIDLNGDGMDDLVGRNSTLLSHGQMDWSAHRSPLVTHAWDLTEMTPIWVDVDGDGLPDLVQPPPGPESESVGSDWVAAGLCVELQAGSGEWEVQLNRTVGNQLDFVPLPQDFRLPFHSGDLDLYPLLIGANLAAPVGPMAPPSVLQQCQLTYPSRPGYLIPNAYLPTHDFDRASVAGAINGWSYIRDHIQFVDSNGDSCTDVLVNMMTGPLKQISGLREDFEAREDGEDHYSELFLGDCAGDFSRSPGWIPGGYFGPPSMLYRERSNSDATVPCSSLPFNGVPLAMSCDNIVPQPWAMRSCEPAANLATCCPDADVICPLPAICAGFACPNGDVISGDDTSSEIDFPNLVVGSPFLTPSSEPAASTTFDPWLDAGDAEPWHPWLHHRFTRSQGGRRAGASLSGTLGAQFVDLDADGRREFLQMCSRADADLSQEDPTDFPLALHYPETVWGWVDQGTACEDARATASGVEFVGSFRDPANSTLPPSMGRHPTRILIDLDGDSFPDELTTDGDGAISARLQQREVPEHALEAITYPWGEYPEATSFLTWRSGDPTDNPNLPFPEHGIVEIIDGNGHRVWARSQCRVDDGDYVGCGIVVEQVHSGAFSKSLYATRKELPHRRWLNATYDDGGQLQGVQISLPAGADLAGLDATAPWFNPAWRECSFSISDGPFDGSLETYVQECLFHASPYVAQGLPTLNHLWKAVSQLGFASSYATGVLGQAISLPGVPMNHTPSVAGPHEMFVSSATYDGLLAVPLNRYDEGYAAVPDDDVRTELFWTSVGGQARADGSRTSSPVSGEVFSHREATFAGWTPIASTSYGEATPVTTSSAVDSFGRIQSVTGPDGHTTSLEWEPCGVRDVTDPLGNVTRTFYDGRCLPETEKHLSSGLYRFWTRDGLAAATQTTTHPGAGQPSMVRLGTKDREVAHHGDPNHPQLLESDGRVLGLTFLDSKGHIERTRRCALASPPTDVSDPASYACVPGTEVDQRVLYTEDSRVWARSGGHRPGEPAAWTLLWYDALGRVTREQSALGTEDQVQGVSPGLVPGPSTFRTIQFDRVLTVLPTGLELLEVPAPLERSVYLDGDLISHVEQAPDAAPLASTDVMGRVTTAEYDGLRRPEQSFPPTFWGVDEATGVETILAPSPSVSYDSGGRVDHLVDARGYEWSFDHDALGRVTHAWGPDGELIAESQFDDAARSVTRLDTDGDAVTTTRDGLGRPIATVLPNGLTSTVVYDAFGGAASATDVRGATVTSTVDLLPDARTRATATYADGSTAVVFANEHGSVLRTVDRDGVARDSEYDGWGRLIRMRLGASNPDDLASWPSGEVLMEQGHDAHHRLRWRCAGGVGSGLLCEGLEYDARSRVTATHAGLAPVNLDQPSLWISQAVWEHGYRDDGSLDWTLDPLGTLTEYAYDTAGHPVEVLVEGISQGMTLRNAAGTPVRSAHPDGSLTDLVLDGYGRVVEQWMPGRTVPTTYGYWPDGALQWTEDGDGLSNPSLPVPADQWLQYDSLGRVTTSTAWNGAVVQYEYDGADLASQTSMAHPIGAVARSEFDWDPIDGRLTASRTALTELCAADGYASGSMASVCRADELTASQRTYSAAGRRVGFVDGGGQATSWFHDPGTGRLKSRSNQTTESHFLYGPGGLMGQVLDGPAASPVRRVDLFRDGRGRVDEQVWTELPSGSTSSIASAFDLMGRPLWSEARRDGNVTEETYTDYDDFGRIVQVAQNVAGIPSMGPVSPGCDLGELCFDYDAEQRVERTTYPNGDTLSFEYSGPLLDKVTCVGPNCPGSPVLQEVLQRDDLGRPVETWRQGDVFETTLYNGGGHPDLQDLEYQNPMGAPGSGAMLVRVDPEYDAFGRETSRVTEHFGRQPLSDFGESRAWTYNAAGWLTSETLDSTSTLFDWDAARNRIATVDAMTGEATEADYGPDNRLEELRHLDPTGNLLRRITFGYDGLGRRLNDSDDNTLSYTPHGRLEQVTDASGSILAKYAFGHDGRRVTEQTPTGGRVTRFGPGSYTPYVVTDMSTGERNIAQLGGAIFGTLEPGSSPNRIMTHQGALAGAPSVTADVFGEVTWQGKWDAWGQPTQADGDAPPMGWRGLLPTGADLPFLGAAMRDYDPTTGTWLQQDPIGVNGGANIYGYADADPVNRSDPSGLCTPQLSMEARAQRMGEYVSAATDQFSERDAGGAYVYGNKGSWMARPFMDGYCDQRCFAGLAWQSEMMGLSPGVRERRAERANKGLAYRLRVEAAYLRAGFSETEFRNWESWDPSVGDRLIGEVWLDLTMPLSISQDGMAQVRIGQGVHPESSFVPLQVWGRIPDTPETRWIAGLPPKTGRQSRSNSTQISLFKSPQENADAYRELSAREAVEGYDEGTIAKVFLLYSIAVLALPTAGVGTAAGAEVATLLQGSRVATAILANPKNVAAAAPVVAGLVEPEPGVFDLPGPVDDVVRGGRAAAGDVLEGLVDSVRHGGDDVVDAVLDVSEGAALRPYGGKGGGHHVPAKKAFEGACGYSCDEALAIPNAELARLGVKHSKITGAQASLYRKFSKTGADLGWDDIGRIETKALVAGGMDADTAATTVRRAILALMDAGVAGPTKIPWGGR